MSAAKEPFRLRTRDDPSGAFSLLKMLRASVRYGEVHMLFVLPHVIIPVYGVYRLLAQYGYWPARLAQLGELALAAVQGLAVGGMLVLGYMRWSASGRALMGRRKAGISSPGEERAQKKIQLGFAISVYVLFATFFWIILPPADGPKAAAIKQTARSWGFDPTTLRTSSPHPPPNNAGFLDWIWS